MQDLGGRGDVVACSVMQHLGVLARRHILQILIISIVLQGQRRQADAPGKCAGGHLQLMANQRCAVLLHASNAALKCCAQLCIEGHVRPHGILCIAWTLHQHAGITKFSAVMQV